VEQGPPHGGPHRQSRLLPPIQPSLVAISPRYLPEEKRILIGDLLAGTEAGMAAARARGHHPGRPTVMTPDRIITAKGLIASGTPISRIAATLGVGGSSIYRALVSTA
jgi:hypothetical protein